MKLVAYYRVSTQAQGTSGLGLAAQREAVATYAGQAGGTVAREYKEVETGKGSRPDRPQLRAAIAHARRTGATLVVAKLDRLARNVAFTAALMESKVPFVCCDNPTANDLTIHVLAAVAENYVRTVSDHTKAALAAAKARGTKLGSHRPGSPQITPAAARNGAQASGRAARRKALADYADLLPQVLRWRQDGATLQAIADRLNEAGHTTRTGKPWRHTQVQRLLQRVDAAGGAIALADVLGGLA